MSSRGLAHLLYLAAQSTDAESRCNTARQKVKSSSTATGIQKPQTEPKAEAPADKAAKPCPVRKYPFDSENDEREPMPDLKAAWDVELRALDAEEIALLEARGVTVHRHDDGSMSYSSSTSSSSRSSDGLFDDWFTSGVHHSPPTKAELVRWRLWLTEHGVPDEQLKALTYGEAYVLMKRLWLREHEKEEIEKEIAHLSQRLGKRAGQPAGVLVRRHTEELPLPEKHVKVLRYLAKQASAVMQTDVAQSTDISEKTVSGICRELTRLRFTSKPLDRKTGVIITQKGRDHLGKCADDSKK